MFLKSLYKNATGFFFPNICIACTGTLTTDKWLCADCVQRLGKNHDRRNACPVCAQNRNVRLCSCLSVNKHPFESAYSIFDFDETIKAIVHEIKYRGQKRLAFDMGKAYCNLIPQDFFIDMHAVVPVPLHFIRLMKRGYNQAEYLARGFAGGSSANIEYLHNILVRKRSTKTQTKLSRKLRKRNVRDAFIVAPKKRSLIHNKNIILVDDIVTTGATTSECARALIAAGAGKIRILSLARD